MVKDSTMEMAMEIEKIRKLEQLEICKKFECEVENMLVNRINTYLTLAISGMIVCYTA